MRNSMKFAFGLVLVGAVGACSGSSAGDSGEGEPSAEPEPQFLLTLSSDKLPVLQGARASLVATIEREEGFEGAVELSASGLPAGAQFEPMTIAAGETSATIEIGALPAAPHSLPTKVEVRASSAGVEATRDLTVTVYGKPGALDTSFAGGKVLVPVGDADAYAHALAMQSDGKVIVAGNSHQHLNDFALLRLTRDGVIDASFGEGGVVNTEIGAGTDVARAVVVDPQGRIVVAGTTDAGASGLDFALVRYLSDGALDESFGDGGKVVTRFSDDADTAYTLLIQPDDKIVVAGDANTSDNGLDFAIARYLDDGRLDPSFGEGGKVIQSVSEFGGRDSIYAFALDSDDRFVAVGGEGDFVLARFLDDGRLDASFGVGGKIAGIFESSIGAARAVRVTADGDVFVAGHMGHDFALAKLNDAGELATEFGADGTVLTPISADNWDEAHGLALEADGSIVVGGWTYEGNSSSGNTALVRYTAEGELDTTFGSNGIVITEVAAPQKADQGSALILQADERVPAVRILVAGSASTSFSEFAVSRFWR